MIEKPLSISGPRDGRPPLVDGRCREAFTILVLGARASLRRFSVTGATDEAASQYGGAEVNFIEGGHGKATDLKLREGCSGTQYGINVFDSEDVTTSQNRISGYLDAAIYVGGIRDPETSVEVTDNLTRGNNRGVLVEDSLAEPEIRVTGNAMPGNDEGPMSAGVYIRNSDGVLIEDNEITRSGFAGVWLDGNSDFNLLNRNSASASGTADLQNDGEGNCGSGNSFGTEAGTPLAAC
jgi:parallel beta-helix repeat protein